MFKPKNPFQLMHQFLLHLDTKLKFLFMFMFYNGAVIVEQANSKTLNLMSAFLGLLVMIFLIYLLKDLIKSKEPKGLIVAFTLILAGAIGNIIDSAFYGMIFSNSPVHTNITAELFPSTGGYSSFLFGKVVDMFYFPLIDTFWPDWVPILGGRPLEFFRPVFNVADSAITIGVFMILLFYHRFLFKSAKENGKENTKGDIEELASTG